MIAFILATILLGPLGEGSQSKALSSYDNHHTCPSRYVPVPALYCHLPSGEVWHEQGSVCHDNPSERGSMACTCEMENVPSDVVVTHCKSLSGF